MDELTTCEILSPRTYGMIDVDFRMQMYLGTCLTDSCSVTAECRAACLWSMYGEWQARSIHFPRCHCCCWFYMRLRLHF